jgi:3-dehydroquinate dehydratase/shikimate dehydrogenase
LLTNFAHASSKIISLDKEMAKKQANICAVITETSVEAARLAIQQAASQADILEVRLDYLRDFDFVQIDNLSALLDKNSLPVILTCRAFDEGGQQQIDNSIRLPLLVEGAKRFADYCDIEAAHYHEAAKLSPDLTKLIVSYHNFEETPDNLNEIYERITSLPAAIHKLATHANTLTDALATFQLLQRAETDGQTLIAIAMNEAGTLTRLLGPAFGSFLTYGSIADGKTSAPGQFSCAELKEVYRINQLTQLTQITGIIGNPVSHSVSPAMHNAAFAALNLDFVYLPIAVDDVSEFFKRFVNPTTREMGWRLRGFSVTIPHKVAVMPMLDEIDKTAAKIGAVNTVVIEEGKIKGYNTDAYGAIAPLEKVCELSEKHCAVIGAGGAARAVIYGLLEREASVSVFARDLQKAEKLADDFNVEILPIETIAGYKADILINTTPIGMHGHSETQSVVPQSSLNNFSIVYDLVYNPLETRLLREAKEEGCVTISGLDMLIEQARLQFEFWTGQKPPAEMMHQPAMKKLYNIRD